MKGDAFIALCDSKKLQRAHLATCKVVLAGDTVPEWVELVPPGPAVNAVDGRRFRNPNPHAVVEAFKQYGLDLPIDYEHASEIRAPEGQEAPAAGWITELEVRDGAIWGKVEWTPKGAASLTTREYRYISPAFIHNSQGEIKELVSAGLTNKPALTQLAELARTQEGVSQMDPELLKALGLPENATKEQVMAAIVASQKAKSDAEAAAATAKTEVATARAELAKAQAPDLNKFVPREQYDVAVARAQKAEKEIEDGKALAHREKAQAAVDAAVKSGKIAPATKDYFLSTCSSAEGLAAFNKFVEGAPVIGDVSPLDGKKPPVLDEQPTEEQLAIAARCGISKDQFVAELKARKAAATH